MKKANERVRYRVWPLLSDDGDPVTARAIWPNRTPASIGENVMGIAVIESTGAIIAARNIHQDDFAGASVPISARSFTPRSFMTAIRADLGEAEAYKQALLRGEIGLQRPMGANVAGVDFITAIRVGPGIQEIVCTDVKTSGRGAFPRPKSILPGTWQTEVQDAVTRICLVTIVTDVVGTNAYPIPNAAELHQLEIEIHQALATGRVRSSPRQLNADYSPAGQGVIGGW